METSLKVEIAQCQSFLNVSVHLMILKHGEASIVKNKLNMLLGGVTSQLEKLYISKSLSYLRNISIC